MIAAGKEHWVTLREDKVVAKGKGELQTYWLKVKNDAAASAHSGESVNSERSDLAENDPVDKQLELQANQTSVSTLTVKQNHIVNWHVDLLQRLLTTIVTHIQVLGVKPDAADRMRLAERNLKNPDQIVIDEVQDVIMLPQYMMQRPPKHKLKASLLRLIPL